MFKCLVPLCFHMVTGLTFNSWLNWKQESQKVKKFQNFAFSLQYIYRHCKEIPRSPTPAVLEHWERSSTATSTSIPSTSTPPSHPPFHPPPPQLSADLQYKHNVILEAIRNNKKCLGSAGRSPHLPNREAGEQQGFGVSEIGQCREIWEPPSFLSSLWLNCSSSDEHLVLCDNILPHPTRMAQHHLCKEITTGNPERWIYGVRKWLYLTGQSLSCLKQKALTPSRLAAMEEWQPKGAAPGRVQSLRYGSVKCCHFINLSVCVFMTKSKLHAQLLDMI